MNTEHEKWQKLRDNYLKQVEDVLASIGHPKNSDILKDVECHLEAKFSELTSEQQNWEGYQNILIEMGPPEEYADLLDMESANRKKQFSIKAWLAVIFVTVLAAVGSYLIYTENQTSSQPTKQSESDGKILGKWKAVDFVKKIDDFNPSKRSWQSDLFLKEIVFEEGGKLKSTTIEGGPYSHQWAGGKVDPFDKKPAAYYLRDINGEFYLFFEWVKGDIRVRGRKPYYYVLEKVPEKELTSPPIEQAAATPIYYIVSFKSTLPSQSRTARQLLDSFNEHHPSGVAAHHYRTRIQSDQLIGFICVDSQSDADSVKQMLTGNDNLKFIEIKPATQKEFDQYSLQKQVSLPAIQQDESVQNISKQDIDTPVISKPSVLGKWLAIDCVKNIEDFNPNYRMYKKSLILKDLHFTADQLAYWNFNNSVIKKTTYTDDTVEMINGHTAKFFQNTIEGQDYLYLEWITPEVVKDGKKADYYVLKRQQEPYEMNRQDFSSDLSPVGEWVSVDFVQNIEYFRPGQKQWRGAFYLRNLTFNGNRTTSGPWIWKQNYLWHPGDRTKSHFTIQRMQGETYLFMEWMSGGVTIRGQKPKYYVLKKRSTKRFNDTSRSKAFTFGLNYCNAGFARLVLGSPSRVDMNGRMLRYNNLGVDLLFSRNGSLSEAHFNKGYRGQLEAGISLNSSKQDVFATYGQPLRTVQTDKLSGRNDERILYQKGNTSRIYYGRQGLIFWFSDNAINQIVVFKGRFNVDTH